jgi:hypothetical protein
MSEHRRTYQDRDGVRRTLCWDDAEPDQCGVLCEQDVSEIMPGIKRDRELLNHKGDNRHVARIPAVLADKVLLLDPDELDWWLETDEAEPYRIWRGRIR